MRYVIVLFTALFLFPHSLRADGFALPGFGAESVALGGTGVADKSGPAALAHNPSGLNVKGQKTTLSYLWAKPILYISRDSNPELESYLDMPADSREESEFNLIRSQTAMNDVHERRAEDAPLLRGVQLGVLVPLAREREEAGTSLGIAVSLPLGRLAAVEIGGESTPYFVEFQDRNQAPVIAVGLGHDLSEQWSVGAGMVIDLVQADVDVSVFTPLRFAFTDILIGSDPLIPEADVQPMARAQIRPRARPTAGIQWRPSSRFAAGLSFREESHGRVDVNGDVTLAAGLPEEAVLGLNGELNTHFQPRRVAAGVQWSPVDRMRLQGDVAWEQWSRYRPPLADYAVDNIRDFARNVLAASGAIDAGVFGNCLGVVCLPDEEALLARIPDSVAVAYEFEGVRNIVLPRVGLGWQWSEQLESLVGYYYRPDIETAAGFQLTRTSTYGDVDGEDLTIREAVDVNVLDNAQHGTSVGLMWQGDTLTVGATLLYVHLVEKHVDKRDSAVTFEDQARASGTQITDFGYPGYRYGGLMVGGMLQVTLEY